LREMVMDVFLNSGGSESEKLVATKVCATAPREASSTHAASQMSMYDTGGLIMAVGALVQLSHDGAGSSMGQRKC
jgi:hypothetical protein